MAKDVANEKCAEVARQSREIGFGGCVEGEVACFDLLEESDGGEAVEHLSKREDGGGAHQRFGGGIGQAVARNSGDVGSLDDGERHPGNLMFLHELGDQLIHSLSLVGDEGVAPAGVGERGEEMDRKEGGEGELGGGMHGGRNGGGWGIWGEGVGEKGEPLSWWAQP